RGDGRELRERADTEGRRQDGAVVERHLSLGVAAGEAVPRTSPRARPARAARRAPRDDYEVTGHDVVDTVAGLLDDSSRFVSEQERKVVVDGAFAVMQVGVTHAARLHADERLARSGLGN